MRIRNFRHKGLRRLYETGNRTGIPQKLIVRVEDIVAILEAAPNLSRVPTFPGLRLHRLKGNLAEYWSITVSDNWRIIFRVVENEVLDLDLLDYH
jgi:proteic killer suppression protein